MSEQTEVRQALKELDEFIQGLCYVAPPARNPGLGESDIPVTVKVHASRDEVIDCFLKANPTHAKKRTGPPGCHARRSCSFLCGR